MSRDFSLPNSKKWDLIAAAPLILWSAIAAAGFAILIYRQWPATGIESGLLIALEFSSAAFLLLQAIMLAARGVPLLKAVGIVPRIVALIGSNFAYLLLLLPRISPSTGFALLSSILVLTGTGASIVTLMFLGKGFSILPQARKFETRGPYRLVRHPLYLVEQISLFGLSIQFLQPWATLIVLAGFLAQLPRMSYEEKIMAAQFPDYIEYSRRTARIIPFVY